MERQAVNIECSGCKACVNICPQKCIDVECIEQGRVQAYKNTEKCTNCGLCNTVCHYYNNDSGLHYIKALAMKASDDIRKKSASGGAMTLLAKAIYEQGGCVYGAAFEDDFSVHHIRTDSIDGLEKIRGSKYIASDLKDIYRDIEKDLREAKPVLFSGTPCQVAAIKKFLEVKRIDQSNLLCVDIICHGVGRKGVWRDYLDDLERKYGKIKEYSFRNKDVSWRGYPIKFVTDREYCRNTKKQRFYIELYNKALIYEEFCYTCKYASSYRVSDITIGDLWESRDIVPEMYDDLGISLMIINSNKGMQYVDLISEKHWKKEIDLSRVHQTNLEHATPRPKQKDKFDELYHHYGYKKVRAFYLWKWSVGKIKQRYKIRKHRICATK